MPNITNTAHKLSDKESLRYCMHTPDEAKVLADDMAFLQGQTQPCPLNKQLQQLYVDLKVNVCYDPFSLMEIVYDADAGSAGMLELSSTVAAVVAVDGSSTVNVAPECADKASLAFEKVRIAICERAMMFDEDADMPEMRAF